jgi:hypothetical protein
VVKAVDTEEIMSDDDDEVAPSKSKRAVKKAKYEKDRIRWARTLQIHDFLLPADMVMIDESFWVCSRPSGERCLVISGHGKT